MLLGGAMAIIEAGDANALVVDLKGDRGIVPYPSGVPLAATKGVRRVTTIPDLAQFVRRMHASGIYVIGRIVVFKDDPIGRARREQLRDRSWIACRSATPPGHFAEALPSLAAGVQGLCVRSQGIQPTVSPVRVTTRMSALPPRPYP